MPGLFDNFKSSFRNVLPKFGSNAIKVSRAKQFSGEVAFELPFRRFYEYYHGWPEVKRGINGIHRRLMGTDISFESDDQTFDELFGKWARIVNLKSKYKEAVKDLLITGTLHMEKQFTPDGKLGNVAHIPMLTMWKAFRDDFGNTLEVVQMIDGQMHRLSPDYLIKYAINNPEEEYFGKSEIFSIAVPQKVTGEFDENGALIEGDKYLVSILDRDARIRMSQLAVAEKQAKSMMFVQVKGETNRERQKEIENDLNSTDTRKWVTLSDKEFVVNKAQADVSSVMKEYTDDMKMQISKATGFPSAAVDEPSSAGFAASQTPIQEMMAQVAEMQKDLAEIFEKEIMMVKAKEWGFDPLDVNPRWTHSAFVEKLTFEQLVKLEASGRISDLEYRAALQQFLPELNDAEFLKWQEEKKQDMQKMAEQNPGNEPGKSPGDSEQRDNNPRPGIEKEAPKPETTSAEALANHPLFKNPKAIESMVKAAISKSKSLENFAQVLFKSTTGKKFETMPPGITEEDIETALDEIHAGKPAMQVAQELFGPGITDRGPDTRQTGNTKPAKKKKIVKAGAAKTYEANTRGDLQYEMSPLDNMGDTELETEEIDKENVVGQSTKAALKKNKTTPVSDVDSVFTTTSGTNPLR
jgi:hypothetical protein